MYTGKNNVTDYVPVPTLTHNPFRCNLELLLKNLTAQKKHVKEARKGFFGCHSVCETIKDTKEGYFIV